MIKRYNEFVNENSGGDSADERLLRNAKFQKGDKVVWSEGGYDYYTIDYPFGDSGRVLYNLRNPEGISSGGRVPETELSAFLDGSHVITEDDARILFGLEEDNLAPGESLSDEELNYFVKDVVGKTLSEYAEWRWSDNPEEQLKMALAILTDTDYDATEYE